MGECNEHVRPPRSSTVVLTNEDHGVAAGDSVTASRWQLMFDELTSRIAGRFSRVEPRRRARAMRSSPVSDGCRQPPNPLHVSTSNPGSCSHHDRGVRAALDHLSEAGANAFLLITLASKECPRRDHIPHGDGDVVQHGARSRSRAIRPISMVLLAICSAVIHGVSPVGRSNGRSQLIRRNSFRIRCSMTSSSRSYGCAPSTRTTLTVRAGLRLAPCAATNAP